MTVHLLVILSASYLEIRSRLQHCGVVTAPECNNSVWTRPQQSMQMSSWSPASPTWQAAQTPPDTGWRQIRRSPLAWNHWRPAISVAAQLVAPLLCLSLRSPACIGFLSDHDLFFHTEECTWHKNKAFSVPLCFYFNIHLQKEPQTVSEPPSCHVMSSRADLPTGLSSLRLPQIYVMTARWPRRWVWLTQIIIYQCIPLAIFHNNNLASISIRSLYVVFSVASISALLH